MKSFFDYQNDNNYAQDIQTGDFINIKTGKVVGFLLRLNKQYGYNI